ncbi:DeoR/GlpR family DNA-binding transcription regulator [Actinomyces glycerinitolerans]|nr:DeoR/GlpR family DNA-binding transcription regulator [Actinomyces glycerinitolerans]
MLAQQRRSAIVEMVKESGGVSVADLARALEVSASTIRRDLNALGREGRLRRVRGGGTIEADAQPFAHVAARAAGEKDRVGAAAAGLVRDRDVVLIDIGTTGAAVARHLRGRDITVVTASLAVVDVLREDRHVELIVLGGVLRPSYLSLVGGLTENALAQISADIAFMGTSGVRADGTVMDSTGIEVPVKRALRAAAERTCLVATADKFPGAGLLPVCPINELEVVITTAAPGTAPLPDLAGTATEVLFA